MFRKVLLNSISYLLVLGTLFVGSQPSLPSATADGPVKKHIRDAIIDNLDLTPGNSERATIKFPLKKGTNIDNQGKQTTVWFILTDVSDEELANSMGLAFSPILAVTPPAATSPATLTGDVNGIGGQWTFSGDLPNNVERNIGGAENNGYSPLRKVTIGGKPDVIVNATFIKWGRRLGERLRIDRSCVSFPDNPPNTNCPYNGAKPFSRHRSGHVLDIDTKSLSPSVTFKLHRELFGTHLSYYIVTDAFPQGPANLMGVPFVPKDGLVGVTGFILQSLPPALSNGNNLPGGGPLGGQSGLPSYFEDGPGYTPMWHIGFIRWNIPQPSEIQSFLEAFTLRDAGSLGIFEFNPPPPPIGDNPIPFDQANPNPPHVVNCPAPLTVDLQGL